MTAGSMCVTVRELIALGCPDFQNLDVEQQGPTGHRMVQIHVQHTAANLDYLCLSRLALDSYDDDTKIKNKTFGLSVAYRIQ